MNRIIKKNPDKDIYLVNWDGASKNKLKFESDVHRAKPIIQGR